MELSKADIEKMEEIGFNGKGKKLFHILTKGGLSIIASQNPSGQMEVLSKASHPAIARHQANMLDNSVQYHEHLFKSEGEPLVKNMMTEYNKHDAFKQGMWHSRMAGVHATKPNRTPEEELNNKNMQLHHTNLALRNLMATGLDLSRAKALHRTYVKEWPQALKSPEPFDQNSIEMAYVAKHKQAFPEAVKSSKAKSIKKSESLEKDRGRITFPADPKITTRPDQEVTVVGDKDSLSRKRVAQVVSNKGQRSVKPIGADPVQAKNIIDSQSKTLINNDNMEGASLTTRGSSPTTFTTNHNQSLKDHEGFHHLLSSIKDKHGDKVKDSFLNEIISGYDRTIFSKIEDYLINGVGYGIQNSEEEAIAHTKELLENQNTRKDFKDYHGMTDDQMQNFILELGSSWKNAIQKAGHFKLPLNKNEDIYGWLFNMMTDVRITKARPKKD